MIRGRHVTPVDEGRVALAIRESAAFGVSTDLLDGTANRDRRARTQLAAAPRAKRARYSVASLFVIGCRCESRRTRQAPAGPPSADCCSADALLRVDLADVEPSVALGPRGRLRHARWSKDRSDVVGLVHRRITGLSQLIGSALCRQKRSSQR